MNETSVIVDSLEVCDDCEAVIANGEIADGTDGETARRVESDQVSVWGVYMASGLVLDGTGPWFSWYSCDGCGSDLAGMRHGASIIRI